MLNSQNPKELSQFTEYGIPIRNLWHMLLYAWDEVPLDALRYLTLEEVEQAPTLDALFASLLIQLMQERLRIGLGRNYVDTQQRLGGLRGRIDFGESLRQGSFERGEAVCDFQSYRTDEPGNQIIRSTLMRLAQTGQFQPETDSVKQLRHKLRRLIRDLDGIDLIELTPALDPQTTGPAPRS